MNVGSPDRPRGNSEEPKSAALQQIRVGRVSRVRRAPPTLQRVEPDVEPVQDREHRGARCAAPELVIRRHARTIRRRPPASSASGGAVPTENRRNRTYLASPHWDCEDRAPAATRGSPPQAPTGRARPDPSSPAACFAGNRAPGRSRPGPVRAGTPRPPPPAFRGAQQLGPRCDIRMVRPQLRFLGEFVQQGEPRRRTVPHRDRNCTTHRHHRRRHEPQQHVVQGDDLRPVGARDVGCLVVQCRNGGLHPVCAGGPPVSDTSTSALPSSISGRSHTARS